MRPQLGPEIDRGPDPEQGLGDAVAAQPLAQPVEVPVGPELADAQPTAAPPDTDRDVPAPTVEGDVDATPDEPTES